MGIIIVGVAGPICGIHYFGFSGAYLGFFGGVIVGGIIGATVGYLIKKRRGKTKTNAQNPF